MGDALNTSVFRRDSPIFRWTGYLPIFPIIFHEKAASLRYGDVNARYAFGTKTVFHPTVAARTASEALERAAVVSDSLARQFDGPLVDSRHQFTDVAHTGCRTPWQDFCRSMLSAIDYALSAGAQVMVVTQPYELGLGDRHLGQQREVAAMLDRRFGRDARMRYVNLGPVVDLQDPSLSYDHMHLTAAGNAIIARALVEPVAEMAALRDARTGEQQKRGTHE
jgi:hypothetical protein